MKGIPRKTSSYIDELGAQQKVNRYTSRVNFLKQNLWGCNFSFTWSWLISQLFWLFTFDTQLILSVSHRWVLPSSGILTPAPRMVLWRQNCWGQMQFAVPKIMSLRRSSLACQLSTMVATGPSAIWPHNGMNSRTACLDVDNPAISSCILCFTPWAHAVAAQSGSDEWPVDIRKGT